MNGFTPTPNPPRLLESNDRVGELLRHTLKATEGSTSRPSFGQWNLIESTLRNQSTTPKHVFGYAFSIAILCVVFSSVYIFRGTRPWSPTAGPSSLAHPAQSGPASPVSATSEVYVEERQVYQMNDGTVVSTSESGRVKITTPTKERTIVQLDAGAVELAVTPRSAGDRLEVIAGKYRFRVIGTRFRVEQNKNGLKLRVTEGKVAVVENDRVLQIVEKDHEWTEPVGVAPTDTKRPLIPVLPVETRTRAGEVKNETNCLLAAREGKHEEALSCFKQQAEGNGVAAEVALYESARIERELLGKPAQALATLNQYQQRFPEGTLWLETRLLAVQLLVELGKDEMALTESQELLQSERAQSRFSELHFLRGKLYRRRGNCAQAIHEYEKAAVSTNSQSDRARLEGASCLEELGHREQARMSYEQLSQSTHANLRNEAKKRLERLNREKPQ